MYFLKFAQSKNAEFSVYEKLTWGVGMSVRIYVPQIPSAASLCANTRCPKCRSRRRVVLRCDAYRMQERILDLHVDSAQAARRIDGW